jgi:hypothetical protein
MRIRLHECTPTARQEEDVEKLSHGKPKNNKELPSKGGLNPVAVVVLLVAIVAGLYMSKHYQG